MKEEKKKTLLLTWVNVFLQAIQESASWSGTQPWETSAAHEITEGEEEEASHIEQNTPLVDLAINASTGWKVNWFLELSPPQAFPSPHINNV